MYEDDWLMRQVRRLAEAIARLARGEVVEEQELEAAVRESTGMDLPTIDALPADAILALRVDGDDRSLARVWAIARVLAASDRAGRRAKGQWLLERLPTR
jgi:hypothetical protein